MNPSKLLRISVNVNGRKALDSKPCASLPDAMANLAVKVQNYEVTSGVAVSDLSMVVGRRASKTSAEYMIAKDLHDEARALAPSIFPNIPHIRVSDHGIA